MVHSGIFATKAQCDSKVGAFANPTGWSEANINSWCAMSESEINIDCSYNFSDAYASLNVDVKAILACLSSDIVAMYGINYDMTYTTQTRTNSEDMLMVLSYRIETLKNILKLQNKVTFIKKA